jgi:hypothetical protein
MTKTWLKALMASTKQQMLEKAAYYGLPAESLEDRHWNKLKEVLLATDETDAHRRAAGAVDKVFITCLSAMSKGKIDGPTTPANLDKRADKADSLATFQEKLGHFDSAKKYSKRAELLRKEATSLRKR